MAGAYKTFLKMTKMNKYADLSKASTPYATRMNRLSNKIFGEVTRPMTFKSSKVVQMLSEKPIHKRPEIVEYYPRLRETCYLMHHLRNYGLYRDEHQDFKEEHLRMSELRGKRIWVPHRIWKQNQNK